MACPRVSGRGVGFPRRHRLPGGRRGTRRPSCWRGGRGAARVHPVHLPRRRRGAGAAALTQQAAPGLWAPTAVGAASTWSCPGACEPGVGARVGLMGARTLTWLPSPPSGGVAPLRTPPEPALAQAGRAGHNFGPLVAVAGFRGPWGRRGGAQGPGGGWPCAPLRLDQPGARAAP